MRQIEGIDTAEGIKDVASDEDSGQERPDEGDRKKTERG
jgi:hypothetical protein